MKKRIVKIIILNSIIIVCAVVTYSPGLLGWYPNDPSVFKAGMSILIALFLGALFLYGNSRILSDEKPVLTNDVRDLTQVKKILAAYRGGDRFGSMAQTVLDQLDRLDRSMTRLQGEIDRRFDKNTLSNDKYSAVINEANLSLVDNLISATRKIQFFDEGEYKRLQSHQNDNIPDEIQLKQLELYKQNEDAIQNVINTNEKLILQLDTLAVELNSPENGGEDLLEEIKKLTQEVKYYK